MARLRTACRFKFVSNFLAASFAFCFVPFAEAELYKYVNDDGVTVLVNHMPAEFVKNGYSILSDDGRLLEVIARALTPQESIDRDLSLLEAQRQADLKEASEQADKNLLRIYSNPEDVIRARDSKIASVEGFIRASTSNFKRLEKQKRKMNTQFANVERAGGVISDAHLVQMRSLEKMIAQSVVEIDAKRQEISRLESVYEADLQRVKALYRVSEVEADEPIRK